MQLNGIQNDIHRNLATPPTSIPRATTWQRTPPPIDRTIVIDANICEHTEEGGCVTPYTGPARWSTYADGTGVWTNGDGGMAICTYADEHLHIHAWIDLPSPMPFGNTPAA